MKSFRSPLDIGILGGGQLAQMLALAGAPRGWRVHVLSQNENDPAAQATAFWQKGDPNSEKDLKKFFKKLSLVTFESEFMDADLLSLLARETGTKIFPQPKTMGLIQDRWTQKKLLTKYKLPTADYLKVDKAESSLLDRWPKGFVLKKRRFGYDGYGTFIIKKSSDLKSVPAEPTGFIAEAFVPFKREVAVIACRSRNGDVIFYPFVESKQKDARCFWTAGPLPETRLKNLKQKIKKMLEGVNYVGAMGIEFFDTGKEFLINELAPRVHNTGHYTQDAMDVSQFENHLKAVLGLPLSHPVPKAKGYAMVNLLGSKTSQPKLTCPKNAALHWYGKSENRPGRKMGHVNSLGPSKQKALKEALSSARMISV